VNLALIIALTVHLVGLWNVLPNAVREHIIAGAYIEPVTVVKLSTIVPTRQANPTPLATEANASIYAVDAASGQVLYAQNELKPRPIASITKLMTVMVALGSHKTDEIITVGSLPNYEAGAERMGLVAGQQFRFDDLLKATLIASDNDAADAIAISTSGTLPAFYAAMNAKAAQWGMTTAHFVSANGLNDVGNSVSAADVARLGMLDLTNHEVKNLIATPVTSISDLAGRTYTLPTTNQLLATGRFYGIKTGYTLAAGQCFVGLTKVHDHEVITVVLGSTDRFGQTQTLVNWIESNWSWL
jgi:D-alanyl-D-alanine carboxypeptidase (penicillin-binding protein 5/6)